jgi:ribose transport system substrate-binding protein
MGYLGVKTMVAHLKGQKVESRVDTGVAVVTKANMNEASAKEVLEPDLSILSK